MDVGVANPALEVISLELQLDRGKVFHVHAQQEHTRAALTWLVKQAGAEWVQFFATDLFRSLREKGQFGELARLLAANKDLKDFARNMRDLIFST